MVSDRGFHTLHALHHRAPTPISGWCRWLRARRCSQSTASWWIQSTATWWNLETQQIRRRRRYFESHCTDRGADGRIIRHSEDQEGQQTEHDLLQTPKNPDSVLISHFRSSSISLGANVWHSTLGRPDGIAASKTVGAVLGWNTRQRRSSATEMSSSSTSSPASSEPGNNKIVACTPKRFLLLMSIISSICSWEEFSAIERENFFCRWRSCAITIHPPWIQTAFVVRIDKFSYCSRKETSQEETPELVIFLRRLSSINLFWIIRARILRFPLFRCRW